jgi:hypothetical protein
MFQYSTDATRFNDSILTLGGACLAVEVRVTTRCILLWTFWGRKWERLRLSQN